MSVRGSMRGAAVVLGLALGLALAPAYPQDRGEAPWSGAAPSWVKLCDRGKLKRTDKDDRRLAKGFELCMTLVEQLNPDTGKLEVGVALQQVKSGGRERSFLTMTVPPVADKAKGASIAVLPPDLWEKMQKTGKLDATDDTRLKARTLKLDFKQCTEAGCTAEMEATPLHVDMLKSNAGLLVTTARSPGGSPVTLPVALSGFAQALDGPPTEAKRLKKARAQLRKELDARRKTTLAMASADPEPRPGGSGAASYWTRVCDRGQLRSTTRDGGRIDKTIEVCMTTTEPFHPETGKAVIVATLIQGRFDGRERHVFSLTIPRPQKQPIGATVDVLPPDLWQKLKRKEKLDSSDESRLEPSALKLPIKLCLPAGCHAETDATPQLIAMLKGGAGLRVRMVGASGKRDSQLVTLDGFEQALTGPPTDMRTYKASREQQLRAIAQRQKARKKTEEQRAKRKKKKTED